MRRAAAQRNAARARPRLGSLPSAWVVLADGIGREELCGSEAGGFCWPSPPGAPAPFDPHSLVQRQISSSDALAPKLHTPR